VTEGVHEFIASLEPRTRAKQGERAQLSAHYVYVLGLR
jgi:hypothetical protein